MDWWNVLIFGAIPALTVLILFFVKRRLLWAAPLVSAALAFVTYMIAISMQGIQSPMIKMFSNNEWRGFFILAMLMHLGIVLVLTAVAYFVGYIKQKRRSKFSRT